MFTRSSQTLTSKPDQQWYIKDNQTKIQLAGTTLCVDAGAKSEQPDEEEHGRDLSPNESVTGNWKDMGSLSLKECSDTEDAQKFVAMADGRIALELSKPRECLFQRDCWRGQKAN